MIFSVEKVEQRHKLLPSYVQGFCLPELFHQEALLIYLLTSWCRVLLEKLTDLQLVKKFPAFHGTRRFITALTSVRHPPHILGQSNPVHIPTSHLLEIHPNIIHPSTPWSSHWSLSLQFSQQDPIHPLSSSTRAKCPAHLILPDFITRTILGEEYRYLTQEDLLACNISNSGAI